MQSLELLSELERQRCRRKERQHIGSLSRFSVEVEKVLAVINVDNVNADISGDRVNGEPVCGTRVQPMIYRKTCGVLVTKDDVRVSGFSEIRAAEEVQHVQP